MIPQLENTYNKGAIKAPTQKAGANPAGWFRPFYKQMFLLEK